MSNSKLEERISGMKDRYGGSSASKASADTYKRLDVENALSSENAARVRDRLSKRPKGNYTARTETGELHAKWTELQFTLAELNEKYGKLKVGFSDMLGKDGMYTFKDKVALIGYSLLLRKNKVKEIKINAAARKGDYLEIGADSLAEVVVEQYQEVQRAQDMIKEMHNKNISHMKDLDKDIVENLRQGYGGGADRIAVEVFLDEIENELKDITEYLSDLEGKVNEARDANDVDQVDKLTAEMGELLDMKYNIFERKIEAENTDADVRRALMKSSHAVESAKAAMEQSKVQYLTIQSLMDDYATLEFMYDHTVRHTNPVLKLAGQISVKGREGKEKIQLIKDTLNMTDELVDFGQIISMDLGESVMEYLEEGTDASLERSRQVYERAKAYSNQMRERKMAYVNQTKISKQSIEEAIDKSRAERFTIGTPS